MQSARRATVVVLLGMASLAACPALARAQGSDVPYVATPWAVVDAMLRLAKVGPGDFVIDLGSGDGRIVIAAAKKHGARGLGVDIDGALVSQAEREARRQGVSDKVRFAARNLFITDIAEASVITMYLFPQVNMRLRPRFLAELRPGTRIVSHEFGMEDWPPDEKITVPVPDKPYGAPSSDVFLWIVPADVAGTWRWRTPGAAQDDEVTLEQRFQGLAGTGRIADRPARLVRGRVRGETVQFTLITEGGGESVQRNYSGRFAGDAIRGTIVVERADSEKSEWQAKRTSRGTMRVSVRAARHMTIAEEQR